jgi:hypothetical protein
MESPTHLLLGLLVDAVGGRSDGELRLVLLVEGEREPGEAPVAVDVALERAEEAGDGGADVLPRGEMGAGEVGVRVREPLLQVRVVCVLGGGERGEGQVDALGVAGAGGLQPPGRVVQVARRLDGRELVARLEPRRVLVRGGVRGQLGRVVRLERLQEGRLVQRHHRQAVRDHREKGGGGRGGHVRDGELWREREGG